MINVIVTFAGWEERFVLGLRRIFENSAPSELVVMVASEYENKTAQNVREAQSLASQAGATFSVVRISHADPTSAWKASLSLSKRLGDLRAEVSLHISTMPRDTIWCLCHHFKDEKFQLKYVYDEPKQYGEGLDSWQSRESGNPRLMIKHSGLMKMGQRTALLIGTGYDVERSLRLVRSFEPDRILLMYPGDRIGNKEANLEPHLTSIRDISEANTQGLPFDAFNSDSALITLLNAVQMLENLNIVATSLGPKPSAIAMFNLVLKRPEIALAYVPSLSYRMDYSAGLGERIDGTGIVSF